MWRGNSVMQIPRGSLNELVRAARLIRRRRRVWLVYSDRFGWVVL